MFWTRSLYPEPRWAAAPPSLDDERSDRDLATTLSVAAFELARHVAKGGTLWCCAPSWPWHAQHASVEFVHPVIVGKRAVAAAGISGPDSPSTLRTMARPGDVALIVADGADPVATDVARRAGAWGLLRIWVGAGPRPGSGAAEHVAWADGDPELATHDGHIVRCYHLLWELAHVCFEHPGLLHADEEETETCAVCADEAQLAEVVATLDTATVSARTPEGTRTLDVSLVGPVGQHDLVLVHGGVAISRADEE